MTLIRAQSLGAIVALLATGVACAPAHVQLVAPPAPGAPVEVRRAFYEAHRPVAVGIGESGIGPNAAVVKALAPSTLLLADGTRVADPRDLVGNVDATSATAQAVARAEEAHADAWLWATATLVTYLSAVALVDGVALATGVVSMSAPRDLPRALMFLNGANGLMASAAMLVGVAATNPRHATAQRERETALLTYDRSLRERLALSEQDREAKPIPLAIVPAAATVTQPGTDARLEMGAWPGSCPDAGRLRRSVTENLGRDPFLEGGDDVVRVGIVDAEGKLTLLIEHNQAGARVGSRELKGHLTTCDELIARAALVISVLLDPLDPHVETAKETP